MKKVNNFYPNQQVWMHNEIDGKIVTGRVSDKFCNAFYKFDRIPVYNRTIIPVIWDDGKNGAIDFRELKVVID